MHLRSNSRRLLPITPPYIDVDGEISFMSQMKDVENSMQHVSEASDVVLCEGKESVF